MTDQPAPGPGTAHLTVTVRHPDPHTANRHTLSLRDWLLAEFPEIHMTIETDAAEPVCTCGGTACPDCQPTPDQPSAPVYNRAAWETYRRDAKCGCTAPDPADCALRHGTGAWLCVCHRLAGPPMKETDPPGQPLALTPAEATATPKAPQRTAAPGFAVVQGCPACGDTGACNGGPCPLIPGSGGTPECSSEEGAAKPGENPALTAGGPSCDTGSDTTAPGNPHHTIATEGAPETNHAQTGIDTSGCDCGHDGMGAGWHASDCAWRTTWAARAASGQCGPECDCGCEGCKHHCGAHQLTADEAREMAEDLSTDLYHAQDALAFAGECLTIWEREQPGAPVPAERVRRWLEGAKCGRQLAAEANNGFRWHVLSACPDEAACPIHGLSEPAEIGPAGLRQQYTDVLRRQGLLDEVNDPEATAEFVTTDLLAVRDRELEQARQHLAAERYEWQQRGEKAEAALRRLDQMATAWLERLPDTIRTRAAAEAVHATVRPALDHTGRCPTPESHTWGRGCPTDQPADTPHVYLSTGCLHGQHDYCQSNTGHAGSKIPAQCKFCQAPCICACHGEQPAARSPLPVDQLADGHAVDDDEPEADRA